MIINTTKNLIYPTNSQLHNEPSFQGSRKFLKITSSCLNKIDTNITPQTISKTPLSTRFLIEQFTPKRIKELAQINCFAADKVKTYFDKLYGQNNYTVIAIGRSVASIAETMKYLGADTKIIPLSGLKSDLPNSIPNVETYKSYLNKIGINLEALTKNPNRKYILFDYSYSGNSLGNCDTFFRKNIFKSNPQNLINKSINEVLKEDFQNNFHLLFSLNRFKDFSSVGKLNIMDLKNCFTQANESTALEYKSNMAKYLRKIFLFNVCKYIKKGNFKNTCNNELKALDKHYLSQKAMRVRLEQILKKENQILAQNSISHKC